MKLGQRLNSRSEIFSDVKLLIYCLVLTIFTGCASTGLDKAGQEPAGEDMLIPEKPGHDHAYLDVYALGDDDWLPVWKPEIIKSSTDSVLFLDNPDISSAKPGRQPAPLTAGIPKTGRGYRVQLANVMDEEEALAIKERAEEIFKSVYIIFRSPNYKVRAGNFKVRSLADAAVDSARVHGFYGAWVVPSKIEFEENATTSE